jgi:hypothetical protein
MDSIQFHKKLLSIRKELKIAIQSEFDKTNLEKIGYAWNLPALRFDFPEIDLEDSIEAISKNGVKFNILGFQSWNKFSNFFDLVKILEYLEMFNYFLNCDTGPVTWDIALSKEFRDPRDINDPEQYLWAPMQDEEGNEIYFPALKLKRVKSGKKELGT